jgi:hypothetical protein
MVKCEPALESERFAREVIGPYRATARPSAPATYGSAATQQNAG